MQLRSNPRDSVAHLLLLAGSGSGSLAKECQQTGKPMFRQGLATAGVDPLQSEGVEVERLLRRLPSSSVPFSLAVSYRPHEVTMLVPLLVVRSIDARKNCIIPRTAIERVVSKLPRLQDGLVRAAPDLFSHARFRLLQLRS